MPIPAINVKSYDENENHTTLPRIDSHNGIKSVRVLNKEYLSQAQLFTSRHIKYTPLPKIVYQISAITEQGRFGTEKKENKDTFLVVNDFAGIKNQYLVAIFDGHGTSGGRLAQYLKDNLPRNIEAVMSLSLHYSTGMPTKPDEARSMKRAVALGYRNTLKSLFVSM